DYFAPDGRPMRKAFLRAPLNFTRVTSNFNPRRFHPITRRVRPHNGTDYGAPTGTPVWAAGDGRVIRSTYNNANGHYVFIQHGNNIITRYLHLHRRSVSVGDRVRQGQTIGTVGMSGMATGPHLHYEFLVNGAHRDPRTVDLPPAQPLPPTLMDDFRRTGEPLLAKLEELQGPAVLLAQREDERCEQADTDC
ncbi:MAG: M23 family metallopeptidase, partial [Wenzhouxiangella sp.]